MRFGLGTISPQRKRSSRVERLTLALPKSGLVLTFMITVAFGTVIMKGST